MRLSTRRLVVVLPLTLLPVALLSGLGTGCELALNLNAPLVDSGVYSDVLDCGICADVSADADYDAPDVSIYGIQPSDEAGIDATLNDAARDATAHDATNSD